MSSAMALWRNLLGMPDHGTTGVRAVADQQLDVVYNFALNTPATELMQLMAGWNRFIALVMAEINNALVRAQAQQAHNKEAWLQKDGKGDDGKDNDRDRSDEADSSSLMQQASATPMYSQMSALQDSLQQLSPRRRAVRAFLLLQYLHGSGHFLHGRRALASQVKAVEQLLMAQNPAQASAYEDADVQWCREVWSELMEAMNRVLLDNEPSRSQGLPQKRPRLTGTTSRPDTGELQVSVCDRQGREIGQCRTMVSSCDGPVHVRVRHEQMATTAASSSSATAGTSSSSTDVTLLVLPCVQDNRYQLWSEGILTSDEVVVQGGAALLQAFRTRWSGELEEQHGSPVSSAFEGGSDNGMEGPDLGEME